MGIKRDCRGFAHLIFILAVVVIAVLGFAGYYLTTHSDRKITNPEATETSQLIPEKINSDQDLEQASKALDADQNNSDLDPAQLDDDLNSLL